VDRRRRFKALMVRCCSLAEFEAMPADYRDQFYRNCLPDPKLVFDPSFPAADAYGGKYADLRRRVRDGFEGVTFETFEPMAFRDLWAVAAPTLAAVRNTLRRIDSPFEKHLRTHPAALRFLRAVLPMLEIHCDEDAVAASWDALHEAVVVPLVSASRLDGRLMHLRVSQEPCGGGAKRMMLTACSEPAEPRWVRVREGGPGGAPGAGGGRGDGARREVFRVGSPNGWSGIEWASWTREKLGADWPRELATSDAVPVYAQAHALKQLRARLDVYAYADWAEHWLYESLNHPKVVSRLPGGELLVPFEVQGDRLGYLVMTAGGGIVTARTFLFLTMRNTPEGRQLRERLRLTSDEVDYLRLHELSRFTHTDLKDDPELRELLSACGCGHLFRLAEDEDALLPAPPRETSFAAELREYVGMAA
jgi:hypothetical protein